MKTNAEGVELVTKFEGFSSTVYLDSTGIPTIGFGNCFTPSGLRVDLDHREITFEEGVEYLEYGLRTSERYLQRVVKVPLTSNQFSSLASLVYNIGSGNFQRSTMRMKLNRGDYKGASNEFWKWRRAGGKILRGLVRRREAERKLFIKKDT